MLYHPEYTSLFEKNLRRYQGLHDRIHRTVIRVLRNPYHNTECLNDRPSRVNLKGCRSARLGRNFRILFVICEECRTVPECEYCFCEGLPDKTVVFLTVGPHGRAYRVHEPAPTYEPISSGET